MQRHPFSPSAPGFEVRVVATPTEAAELALAEFDRQLRRQPEGLISFATGRTYTSFFAALGQLLATEPDLAQQLRGTHLDEFIGVAPQSPRSMAGEIFSACEPLARAFREGRFHPVPGTGNDAILKAHEAKLAAAGGVALQFLGLGSNGHIAFNEPGTPWDAGFHVAQLAASTRADLAERFRPAPVPERASTAGPASILSAKRIVLVATGASKATAVAGLLSGRVSPELPASCVHQHPSAVLILDAAAAPASRSGSFRSF